MTQAGPLTLTPSALLAPASGWLAQIATFLLLAGVGLLVLPPLLYLASAAVKAGDPGAVTIGSLVGLAVTTLSLATLATSWALLLALPLAWLVIRTDLPFRTLCRWLAVIPLAIPSYIGAMSYIALMGPVGSVNTWLSALLGTPQQWVNIYGWWGGVFVLGVCTYPYIFQLVSAALEATNPAVEETARSLGDSPLGVFRRVTLPMLRPSMLAGGLLAFLYALSDFGSPSLLRVQVFTTAIYHQLNTRFDQAAAAMLSFVLVLITIAVLIGQQMLLRRRSYVTITGTARLARPLHLGRWRWPAALLAGDGPGGILVAAYLIRFLTPSVQGVDAALTGINPHLEEAARSLAASPWRVLRRVLAPLVRPTLFAVWALVFISAMKELDATLLLRPAGFDTLPVRVYIHTVEAEYARAAVMALLLIAFTALPWMVVARLREKKLV